MKKIAVMTRPIARVNTDKVGYSATGIGLAIGFAAIVAKLFFFFFDLRNNEKAPIETGTI
jgi:hypothetical protein